MKDKKLFSRNDWISLGLIALAFLFSVYYAPKLPEIVPVHWGANGEANGYGPKWLNLYLLPGIALFVFLLMSFIPKVDPLKQNYRQFAKAYEGMKAVLVVFFLSVYAAALYSSANPGKVVMAGFMAYGIGLLFVYIGYLLPSLKRNWFAGIKTPWTISSDFSWEKTHALGGKLFTGAGIVTILANLVVQRYAFAVMMASLFVAAIVPMVYSYFAWKSDPERK